MQEKKYYPDVAYNRSRRNKFYMTLALLVVCMGLSVGAMIAIKQYLFGILRTLRRTAADTGLRQQRNVREHISAEI